MSYRVNSFDDAKNNTAVASVDSNNGQKTGISWTHKLR